MAHPFRRRSMRGSTRLLAVTAVALILIAGQQRTASPASPAGNEVATIEPGDCRVVGGTKTCVLKQAWGTQTTYLDADATDAPGPSLRGLTGAELAFDDVRARPLEPSIVIGRFMLAVLPGSTPAQCDALISRIYVASMSKSEIIEYGWRWKVSPGTDPAKTMIFTAFRQG